MKPLLEKWRQYLKETKLRVFDFDDTLVKSDSKIKVIRDDGTKAYISTAEFAIQGEKPGHEYDYSEFKYVVDPHEIKKVTNILRNVVKAGTSGREIAILSARAPESETSMKKYLQGIDIDISKITFALLGDADPKAKSDWIKDRIINNNVKDVLFLDDSGKNVAAVKQLQDDFPDIKLDARKVSYAEEIEENFQQSVKKRHSKMKIRLIGTGANTYNVGGKMKKPSYKRSKSAPAGFGGS